MQHCLVLDSAQVMVRAYCTDSGWYCSVCVMQRMRPRDVSACTPRNPDNSSHATHPTRYPPPSYAPPSAACASVLTSHVVKTTMRRYKVLVCMQSLGIYISFVHSHHTHSLHLITYLQLHHHSCIQRCSQLTQHRAQHTTADWAHMYPVLIQTQRRSTPQQLTQHAACRFMSHCSLVHVMC